MNAIFGNKLTQTLHCMSIYAFVLSLPFKELGGEGMHCIFCDIRIPAE
jgi:hypothetical protein